MVGRVMFPGRGGHAPLINNKNGSSSAPASPTLGRAHVHSERPNMENLKRASITGIAGLTGKHKKGASKLREEEVSCGQIHFKTESPPLIFHGPKTNSTGACLTGIFELNLDEAVVIKNWSASVSLEFKTKKPVHKDCTDCAKKTDVIREWTFTENSTQSLNAGKYTHPINAILSGALPASTQTTFGEICWVLRSVAETSSGQFIKYDEVLQVNRALRPLEHPHRVVREFPPSHFLIDLHQPKIVHPDGEMPIYLSVRNVSFRTKSTHVTWRVRKANWTLFEDARVIMPSCVKHRNQPGASNRGVLSEEYREVSADHIADRWKYDYKHEMVPGSTSEGSTGEQGGKAEMEFNIQLDPSTMRLACDVDTPYGFSVTHTMVLDILISEDLRVVDPHLKSASIDNVEAHPTGQARMLRAKFNVIVTEHSGISWEQEVPPVYDEVPPSPPGYGLVPMEETTVEDWGLEAERTPSTSSAP